MPGLLSTGNSSGGLLTGLLAPQGNLGATAEAMRRQREREAAMRARQQAEAQAAAARAAPPHRDRVSGWRVFDRVLGGQTVTEGLDAERERLTAEAMRPQMQARMETLRAAAQQMGPAAMIAFETNPEAFGAQLAEQYAPQVIAAGGVQSVIGNGQRVSAPRDMEFGDSLIRTDPLQPAPQTLMQRGPTFSEGTARIAAEKPIELAPGAVALNRDGSEFGRGAPRILAAADATDLVSETGQPIYQNQRDAPPVDPARAQADAQRAQQAAADRLTMADNLQTGLAGSRRFVDAAGAWTHLMPWQRQARANLEGHLETIKGNISFEKLMEMKANSPNGASGLGALSDREARMLANTVGALDADMSPQELERSFEVIDRLVAKMRQEAVASPAAGVSREAAIAELRRRGRL